MITVHRYWPFKVDVKDAIKGAEATVRRRLMEGIPHEQIFAHAKHLSRAASRSNILNSMAKKLSSTSSTGGRITEDQYVWRPSLGELLVIRIAYFKGTLAARADPNMYRKQRRAQTSTAAVGTAVRAVARMQTDATRTREEHSARYADEGAGAIPAPSQQQHDDDVHVVQMEHSEGSAAGPRVLARVIPPTLEHAPE